MLTTSGPVSAPKRKLWALSLTDDRLLVISGRSRSLARSPLSADFVDLVGLERG